MQQLAGQGAAALTFCTLFVLGVLCRRRRVRWVLCASQGFVGRLCFDAIKLAKFMLLAAGIGVMFMARLCVLLGDTHC